MLDMFNSQSILETLFPLRKDRPLASLSDDELADRYRTPSSLYTAFGIFMVIPGVWISYTAISAINAFVVAAAPAHIAFGSEASFRFFVAFFAGFTLLLPLDAAMRRLLGRVYHAELREYANRCCGFDGARAAKLVGAPMVLLVFLGAWAAAGTHVRLDPTGLTYRPPLGLLSRTLPWDQLEEIRAETRAPNSHAPRVVYHFAFKGDRRWSTATGVHQANQETITRLAEYAAARSGLPITQSP